MFKVMAGVSVMFNVIGGGGGERAFAMFKVMGGGEGISINTSILLQTLV